MKRLLLVGAGDAGREIYNWALDMRSQDWEIAGFLDDQEEDLSQFHMPIKVLGRIHDYYPQPADVFVCCIANPATRLKVVVALKEKGAIFTNIIHPTAVISPFSRLGVGCIVGPYSYIANHAVLNDFVMLNVYTGIGHDAVVGLGCTLSNQASLAGYVVLEEGVFMGGHSCVIPGKIVGAYATVGAGSAVMRHVASRTTVVGVPAKKLM